MSEPDQPQQRRRLRMEAMRVHCPVCGAFPQQSCIARRGRARLAIHRDRYEVGAPTA